MKIVKPIEVRGMYRVGEYPLHVARWDRALSWDEICRAQKDGPESVQDGLIYSTYPKLEKTHGNS